MAALKRVLGLGVLAGITVAAGVSMGFAPSFATSKPLGRASASPNPLDGKSLFVDPGSNARRNANKLRTSKPNEARALDVIASQPQAVWLNEWAGDVKRAVSMVMKTAGNALPVLVAYNIPNRDCGSHSAGGSKNANAYRKWIRDFAAGLSGKRSVIVLEPDGTAGRCASEERYALLRDAVKVLKAAGAAVYIDAGNPNWIEANEMGARLKRAGIADADGFALNVSNYYTNAQNIAYGERVSAVTGGKHFIIDSSRNGNGSRNGEWCNPRGRAIGMAPTVETRHHLVDAYLWIKRPGESDGECAGGPRAGAWWSEYAIELAQRQPTALAVNN